MPLKRKQVEPARFPSVARVAAQCGSHEELVREAIRFLSRVSRADRLGVWLADHRSVHEGGKHSRFDGAVINLDGEGTPREWARLSPEPAFFLDQLQAGKTVDYTARSPHPLLGPAAGLGRVLWVPIRRAGQLQGILLVGSRLEHSDLPKDEAESLAAELSLVLELQYQHDLTRCLKVDLKHSREALAVLPGAISPELFLERIVTTCTEDQDTCGLAAQFAAVGRLRKSKENLEEDPEEVEFVWKSGAVEWLNALHSEPLDGLWKRAIRSKRTAGMELNTTWTRGGASRAVAIPLNGAAGILGVLATALDVTDSSLANLERLELQASCAAAALAALEKKEDEDRHAGDEQMLLEACADPLLVVDASGRVLRANRAAMAQLGQSVQPGTHPSLAESFRARDRVQIETWIRRLEEGAADRHHLIVGEFRDGRQVRVRHVGPAPGGLSFLSMEILESPPEASRKGAPAELQALIEWLDQGVILFDQQNRIQALNPRFAQLVGLFPDETTGVKGLEELVAKIAPRTADPEVFAQRWREASHDPESSLREEVHLITPASRVLERVTRPIQGTDGTRLGRIELYRDLTSQRLLQSRLLHTEKLAALGQMIGGVAHELSNPLTSIVGYTQRLLLRNDELGKREEVHRIFAEAERASSILRRMLLTAREAPPERRAILLNEVVQRTVELQKFSMAAERLRVELDLDPLVGPIMGDAGQLQQVLMNLLGNARQAIETQEDGGVIRVSTARLDGGERVRLEVADNGAGIPEQLLGRIFDPFFTTKPAGVGTGLGLAIVLSIVREHGGQVYVKSPPGQGATFTIDLPASARGQALPQQPIPADTASKRNVAGLAVAPSPRKGKLPPRKVLVVEDEPTVAQLIADVLQDEGFRVEVALRGSEARQLATRQEFDLIVCDMKMPGFDGAQFYRALVREENPLHHKFLFVTGDVLAPQTREFLERSGLAYVAKPFRVEELTEKVQRVLADARVREASHLEERKNAATKG